MFDDDVLPPHFCRDFCRVNRMELFSMKSTFFAVKAQTMELFR